MVRIRKIHIFIIIFNILSLSLLAQNINDITNGNNFWQIKDKLDKYLISTIKDSNYKVPHKGWKQHKRAEAFWQSRLLQNGDMASPKSIYTEAIKFLSNYKKRNKLQVDKQWISIGPATPPGKHGTGKINCIYPIPNDSTKLWIGSASGGMWKSTDSGNSWNVAPFTDFISNGIMDIAISPTNPNIIYATSGDPYGVSLFKSYSLGVLKSIDSGKTWDILSETLDFADSIAFFDIIVHPINPDIVYASTNRYILKSINGGNSWYKIFDGYYFRDMKFHPINPDIIYATTMSSWSTGNAKIFYSENAGEDWNEMITLPDVRRIEIAVTPAKPDNIYILTGFFKTYGGMDGLFVTRDRGLNWDTLLSRVDSNDDFVVGQSFHNLTIAVSPIDTNFIIIAGVNAGKTTDGGKNWNIIETSHVDHHDIKFIDTNIFFCHDGGVNKIGYKTLYNRKNPKTIDITNNLVITQYYRIGVHPYTNSRLLSGSQDNGGHLYREGDWFWIVHGDGMECQYWDKAPERYVTTTQRMDWQTGEASPWISTFLINPHNDKIIAITSNVYQFDFYGNDRVKLSDFQALGYNGELRTLAISKSDSNYIYTSSINNLFKTNNYGKDWVVVCSTASSISDIEVNPDNPEHYWTSLQGNVHNEKVYEYRNNDITNISYNLPNIAVNTIVYIAEEQTLYIGTDMGVFRLENDSTEWKLFNDGMPFVSVNELEYNQRTGYLTAATWGRGIWQFQIKECHVIKPYINLSGEVLICENGEPLMLYNSNKQEGYNYVWNNGNKNDTIYIDDVGADGKEYYLIGIAPSGCSEISNAINVRLIKKSSSTHSIQLLTRNPACVGDTIKYKATYIGDNTKKYFWVIDNPVDTIYTDTISVIDNCTAIFYEIDNQCGFKDSTILINKFVDPLSKPIIEQYGKYLVCNSNAYNYQWKIDDSITNIENKNYIEINKAATYQVITYNEGYCKTLSDTFIIDIPQKQENEIIKATIYPNPNRGYFTIELFYEGSIDIEFTIYDNLGKIVDNWTSNLSNYFNMDWNLNAAAGHYILQIKSPQLTNYTHNLPFIINH